MATAAEIKPKTLEPEQRVVLRDLSWEGYETMLGFVGDSHVRLTYDRGSLELMSPSFDHEAFKEWLGLIVKTVAKELRIPYVSGGSTTWRRQTEAKGLEPDACFYLGNLPQWRGEGREPDLTIDPPPALAIEIEISRSALDRMGIYAALGVPEIWRFDGETLRIDHLQPDGQYSRVVVSPNLPWLASDEIVHWLRLAERIGDEGEWSRQLDEWVRNVLAPRQQGR